MKNLNLKNGMLVVLVLAVIVLIIGTITGNPFIVGGQQKPVPNMTLILGYENYEQDIIEKRYDGEVIQYNPQTGFYTIAMRDSTLLYMVKPESESVNHLYTVIRQNHTVNIYKKLTSKL